MPRIDDTIMESVIYLYPSTQDAQLGMRAGGSGFLVSVPLEENKDRRVIYAVTNSHVIRTGSPVIRLNTTKGDMEAIDIPSDDWLLHPEGDDVAVCPIGLDASLFKFKTLPTHMFLSKEVINEFDIGPGDEAFLVGRFINHEGKQRNIPSVRFGNIAMMPWEPIQHPSGILQESFLVEAHSINGYSGSPVFVFIPSFSLRPGKNALSTSRYGPWLLGVDWGHIPLWETVKRSDQQTDVPEKWQVKSATGMMAVVPAWRLLDLLNIEELVMHRKRVDKEVSKHKADSGVVLDAVREGLTREEFERTLRQVSRRTIPSELGEAPSGPSESHPSGD